MPEHSVVDLDLTLGAPDDVERYFLVRQSDSRIEGQLQRAIVVALVAIAVLNILDIATTRVLLAQPGVTKAAEANPVARILLGGYRVDMVKLALCILLALRSLRRRPTVGWACALWAVSGYYVMTIVSNSLLLSTFL